MNPVFVRLLKLLVFPVYLVVYAIGFIFFALLSAHLMVINYLATGEANAYAAEEPLEKFLKKMRNFY